MPHMVALVRIINRGLDRDGDLGAAAAALENASTVLEAARAAEMLDHDSVRSDHAEALLGALPPAVDAALLATLRSAVGRGVGAVLQWKPGPSVELQVWEAVEGDVGHVGILLVTPPARELQDGGVAADT